MLWCFLLCLGLCRCSCAQLTSDEAMFSINMPRKCGETVRLAPNIRGGFLEYTNFGDNVACTVTIAAPTHPGTRHLSYRFYMQFEEFEVLDVDRTTVRHWPNTSCRDVLFIYNGLETSVFTKPIGWEVNGGGLCGDHLPGDMTSNSSVVSFKFRTDSKGRNGLGFRLRFTLFYDINGTQSCDFQDFHCHNNRCVSDTFHCDHHNSCGDRSDELNCTVPNKSAVEDPDLSPYILAIGLSLTVLAVLIGLITKLSNTGVLVNQGGDPQSVGQDDRVSEQDLELGRTGHETASTTPGLDVEPYTRQHDQAVPSTSGCTEID